MVLSDVAKKTGLELLTDEGNASRDITGCYIGDLLSWVMSKAQPGNVWITVQTNINILAVATLTDVACIVLPENITPDEATLKKANIQGIAIYKSSKDSYHLACELSTLI